ncbi:hypothetical protein HAN_1g123 (nucleomorph) [Hemiselmis andersenii]|uniref:E3 ubiquitin protein ligase n=1 Tax=Hemiselmis andersenii TaxID=464988 RepID=A9BKD0_HEMAN|nr:hypothetical protein HAN_1g123 [Hemiselmis andersenii]ABW97963.1 hypothetical protein HAN_1g123 [Hemiselmis andersenii]
MKNYSISFEKISSHFFLFLCTKFTRHFLDNALFARYLSKEMKKTKILNKKYSIILQGFFGFFLIINKVNLKRINSAFEKKTQKNFSNKKNNFFETKFPNFFERILLNFGFLSFLDFLLYDHKFIIKEKFFYRKVFSLLFLKYEKFLINKKIHKKFFFYYTNFVYFNQMLKLFYHFIYDKKKKNETGVIKGFLEEEFSSQINWNKFMERKDLNFLKKISKTRFKKLQNFYINRNCRKDHNKICQKINILQKIFFFLNFNSKKCFFHFIPCIKKNKNLNQIEELFEPKIIFRKKLIKMKKITENICKKNVFPKIKLGRIKNLFFNWFFVLKTILKFFFLDFFLLNRFREKRKTQNENSIFEKKENKIDSLPGKFINNFNPDLFAFFYESVKKNFFFLKVLVLVFREKIDFFRGKKSQKIIFNKLDLNFKIISVLYILKKNCSRSERKQKKLFFLIFSNLKKMVFVSSLFEKIIKQQNYFLQKEETVLKEKGKELINSKKEKTIRIKVIQKKLLSFKKKLNCLKWVKNDQITDILRKKINCPIKKFLPKEVALINCGHLFSSSCIKDLLTSRNRKCPLCRKNFGPQDIKPVFLN